MTARRSRPRRLQALLFACALVELALGGAAGWAAAPNAPAVVAVGLTVSDLDRAASFFSDVLDFRKVGETVLASGDEFEHLTGVFGARAQVGTYCLGSECLELTDFLVPEGRAIPADSRSNDRWFQHVAIVVSDMGRASARLRTAGVAAVSTAPQRLPDWNPAAGGIEAFYFRDGDGHNLELIAYPPGKGDPRWQAKDRLFLGIDHTAIAVARSAASLAFWRDALGLEVGGRSENWGPEQEHLNQVFGARLAITGLHGAPVAARRPGIGVEFLEYLSPAGGRPTPADLAANDLAHWQIRMEVDDLETTARRLRDAGGSWVSPGPVTLAGDGLGYRMGVLLRDPDGHGLLLTRR